MTALIFKYIFIKELFSRYSLNYLKNSGLFLSNVCYCYIVTTTLFKKPDPQLSQACSDRKKSPSTFDNKIVNCSHHTTIFHWNWKEKLRFVGGLVVHLQKFPPNLGRIGCVSQVINPTNLNFSFQFQWKMVVRWLQFTILLSNSLGLFFLSLHAWDNCALDFIFWNVATIKSIISSVFSQLCSR